MFTSNPTTCHVSHVMCHMSCVTCQVSLVICHMLNVTRHMSQVKFFLYFFCGESVGVSWWKVCYQRGLPCLVYQLLSVTGQTKKIFVETESGPSSNPDATQTYLKPIYVHDLTKAILAIMQILSKILIIIL